MKEETLKTIINHIENLENEGVCFEQSGNKDYIVAVLNNGERLKGLCGYVVMSYGLLRLCDAEDMSADDENTKWYCVPAEEVRYIESTIPIPYTGSFSEDDTLD